ncbi:hypothetical protein [Nonomuraea longispora]|uniref:hypothetical protein n=1 Tax=Nonomuraea longispora TaxID=1848320 RepID=UPI00140539F7|nr:hypothetical protein [Nonomuraea longispora]
MDLVIAVATPWGPVTMVSNVLPVLLWLEARSPDDGWPGNAYSSITAGGRCAASP